MIRSSKRLAGVIAVAALARLLLVPCEMVERNTEFAVAYREYRWCQDIHFFCVPADPCPKPNCMGNYLNRAAQIDGRYRLLSLLERRNLLSDWRPYWHYTPAP